jgi:H/ACA ribonucleoprotein complex subunit 4
MTSHDVVQAVKARLGAGKAGHTGTLDSPVTGLLVIALGEATKAMPVLMGLDKEYVGTMHVNGDVGLAGVREAAKGFLGPITQVPPKKSRVARKPRERVIRLFSVTGVEGRDFGFRVRCQAGTYIRKLVHDLGERLGCGAHMTRLRRTGVGKFSVKESKPIGTLEPSDVMPLENALERAGLKKVSVDRPTADRARNGMPVERKDALKADRNISENETVGIFFQGRIVALAVSEKGRFRVDRVFSF